MQVRIQKFSSGGVQHPKNFDKQKKKKKQDTKGVGGGFTIYSALLWLKSNLAIETAFSDKIWGAPGVCPTQKHIWHNSFSIV